MNNRVVVTGMGVVAPNGANLEAFKESLMAGRSGIRAIEELKTLGFGCWIGGKSEIPKGQLPPFFKEHRLDRTSDFIQLACLAGVEAWLKAGLPLPKKNKGNIDWNTGIIIGTGTPGVDTLGDTIVPLTKANKVRQIGAYAHLNIMGNGPGAYLSSILATGNVNTSNSSACCTGTDAIVEAYHRIKSGRATRMIAGSTEGYSPYKWAGLDAMRVLNRSMNDRPEAASRPMSTSADGFVPASGAGILILEDLEVALARGANIIAEIKAGHSNSGGQRKGGSLTYPGREGVLRCLKKTVEASELDLSEIDLISGHLTATKADVFEVENWCHLFKNAEGSFPKINAPKSLIGHGLGAAGGIESVACMLQLEHSFIHGSLNCEDLHPGISALVPRANIPTKTLQNARVKVIVKASFGFGDVNAALIFKRWH